MEKQLAAYALLFTLSTSHNSIAQNAELSGNCESTEVPGSRELHQRLGRPDVVEKQFATITFRKKTHEQVFLNELVFSWNGQTLPKLQASLFKKDPDKQLKPTEENHLADGVWSNTTKELTFKIHPSMQLQGTTSFAITLTLDKATEKKLGTGSFTLKSSSLPEPFRETIKAHPLVLSLIEQPTAQNVS